MRATDNVLPENSRKQLLKGAKQGAYIRSVASLFMWLFALFSFFVDEIQKSHFIGVTGSVLFLVLIGPPTLFILKRITGRKSFDNFHLFFNMLDVLGITTIIYSLGGFEATYLTPIYAAYITYLGVTAPQRVPFIIAGFCALTFGLVVALEAFGVVPSLKVDPHFDPSHAAQFIRVSVVIGLLFIIAYISSFTAGQLKQGRNLLCRQNRALEAKSIQLENSKRELHTTYEGLEAMVTELHREIDVRKKAEMEREKLIEELKEALTEIKELRGIIPICSFCKKVRDDKGYWEQVDVYIYKYLKTEISHGVCPDCAKKNYTELYEKN